MSSTRTHRRRLVVKTPSKWNPVTRAYDRLGPDFMFATSLCGNTTYANIEAMKLVEDWDEVDCPSCLHIVWINSPCSKSKKKSYTPDTDARAILVRVNPNQTACRPQPHEEHLVYERDEDDWWCLGVKE